MDQAQLLTDRPALEQRAARVRAHHLQPRCQPVPRPLAVAGRPLPPTRPIPISTSKRCQPPGTQIVPQGAQLPWAAAGHSMELVLLEGHLLYGGERPL